ncbi:hypothetical protein CRV24_000691 [Beauveria bassiana]|nr:hypothetical protein CRV24_000691 [Beauveria bassiana]
MHDSSGLPFLLFKRKKTEKKRSTQNKARKRGVEYGLLGLTAPSSGSRSARASFWLILWRRNAQLGACFCGGRPRNATRRRTEMDGKVKTRGTGAARMRRLGQWAPAWGARRQGAVGISYRLYYLISSSTVG